MCCTYAHLLSSDAAPVLQIVPMLAHHNDATAAEVLAFLSVFLYDGNERVQVRLMCVFTCVGGGLWSLCC